MTAVGEEDGALVVIAWGGEDHAGDASSRESEGGKVGWWNREESMCPGELVSGSNNSVTGPGWGLVGRCGGG